jgi:hypothetical protein
MKNLVFKALRIACTILVCTVAGYAQTSDIKDIQQARQKLIIGPDVSKYLSSIAQTISGAATHNQSPTAKAVYDYIQSLGYLATVTTTARLTGTGTSGSPLDIAQQGATTGQVLRWSGSAWVPNGTNLYDIVSADGTIAAQYNQVWVNTLTTGITLQMPACNAANNGIKIEIAKGGSDSYGVIIDPAGSETFFDGQTSKTLYSTATAISCTCRWNGSSGSWLFINM